MSARLPSWLAWLGVALFVGTLLVGLIVAPGDLLTDPYVWAISAVAATGATLAIRRPDNPIGWLLLAFAVLAPTVFVGQAVARDLAADGQLVAAAWIETVSLAFNTATIVLVPATLLLFPDGKLATPRFRPVMWSLIPIALLGFLAALINGGWGGDPSQSLIAASPLRDDLGGVGDVLAVLFYVLLVLVFAASAFSLLLRFRRAGGEERHQIKWVAVAAAYLVVAAVVTQLAPSLPANLILASALAAIPVAIGIAVLRYRLYDIDVVISRSLTYGLLALFITAVYVAIVVGVGSLFGQGDEPNLALAIGATAIVALLFEPIRERLQRWANRVAYGDRASPYSVLSELSARYTDAASSEEALQRLAELLVAGTGAEETVVWLRVGDRLRPEVVSGDELPPPVDLGGSALPALPGDASEAVLHGDELLGALSITKERGQPVTSTDRQLLEDVAAGAGLLLRNIRLNAELEERAEDLRVSRRRLIAAQDAERRRLERNLHDGAQQQVVALKVKLGLARTMAEREEVEDIASAVADLADDTQRAVDGMRAAARGIYPPLLEAEGLRAALLAATREAGTSIVIDADNVGRYPPEIEATVYFSVVEALGPGAHVRLAEEDGQLTFVIRDGSAGAGLAAVADRVEALGGALESGASPSGMRRIIGRLPVTALEPV